ncbi:glycosyltransferase [Muribaculum intestinale]|uniref:glycosyltransferase n=1 Tax=Muribaculum intestinale TaxID=1796646 RepID=UPI003F67B292
MKISIITATWNSGATLRDTMESVLSQDYTDFEHLIIDGGSTDNTLDIVRELEPRYGGKLKWISERDRGIYDAMNKGIMMATGDVIGILNSDDSIHQPIYYQLLPTVSTIRCRICRYPLCRPGRFDQTGTITRRLHSADGRCDRIHACHPSFYCRRSYIHDSVV